MQIEIRIRYKQAYKAAGLGNNCRKEQAVSKAVGAAQDIADSFMTMLDKTIETLQVTSMQDISCKYEVTNAGTANASCTCSEGQLHYICKHMVKQISVKQGFSGAQIIQALRTTVGSTQEGLANLYSEAAFEPPPQTDAFTELDSTFALTSPEPEAAAQPSFAPAPIPAAAHDSTQTDLASGEQDVRHGC